MITEETANASPAKILLRVANAAVGKRPSRKREIFGGLETKMKSPNRGREGPKKRKTRIATDGVTKMPLTRDYLR